jgi:hypothetical protein
MTVLVGSAASNGVIREFRLPIVREIPPAPVPAGAAW